MRRKARIPIQWGLFAAFVGFTAFILALLWLVQILFLDEFHYLTMRSKMARTSQEVVEVLDRTDTVQQMQQISAAQMVCISVYRVSFPGADDLLHGGSDNPFAGEDPFFDQTYSIAFSEWVNAEHSFGCVIHKSDSAQLRQLYDRARTESGTTVLQWRAEEGRFELDVFRGGGKEDRLIFVRLTSDNTGTPLMVLLDGNILPVEPTVNTLKVELLFLSVLLLLLSLGLSFFLSRRISRPIERINTSAKQLAHGRYDVHFEEGDFREIAELSGTLNTAATELSQVDRLQKELIANISHDLRTPLTMIIGYSEVMRDLQGENTPENVQVIIDEATRLSELVDDLLAISNYQSGNRQMTPERLRLDELLSVTVARYRHLKGHSGFSFFLEDEGEVYVQADRKLLLQALCNLLNNAVNYSDAVKEITVRCRRTAEGIRVEVCDRGQGIPAEELGNIWQRYYKVDKNHRRASAGSGLGLSIVQSIFEQHGAKYGVESIHGEGSCFWFVLPEIK